MSREACLYGHNKESHKIEGSPELLYCRDCILVRFNISPENLILTDVGHEYKRDNLRYLEDLSHE